MPELLPTIPPVKVTGKTVKVSSVAVAQPPSAVSIPIVDATRSDSFNLRRWMSVNTAPCFIAAITAKIGTEEQRKNAAAFCVDAITNQPPYTSGMDNIFGPGWTDTLLAPLLDYGYEKEVIAFVKKAYGAFIDVKAPTFGENFLPSEHNSAHGWGASVNTLLDRILKFTSVSLNDTAL